MCQCLVALVAFLAHATSASGKRTLLANYNHRTGTMEVGAQALEPPLQAFRLQEGPYVGNHAQLKDSLMPGQHVAQIPGYFPAGELPANHGSHWGDGSAGDWEVRDQEKEMTLRDLLMNIAGGTGASVSGTGDTVMDQALLRRMRYQDKAVMLLLLMAYTGSLLFSASIAYRQAMNDSPVSYYADPRFHNLTSENQDVESFLEAFNQPPCDAQLHITGLVPLPPLPDYVVDAAVMWLGARYRIAFSFALDLSPWLVPTSSGDDADDGEHSWAVGVPQEDVELLQRYLDHDTNDLSFVELQKEVEWKDWEELATNIKSQIRQGGFNGYINVRRSCEEVVAVHKNKLWANFMHSRTTKVLLALSVVGWFIYQPYIWLRHHAISVRCKYRVDINIGQYWPLIADKIGPDGFSSGVTGVPPVRASTGRGPMHQPRW